MSEALTDRVRALLEAPHLAHVGTLDASGAPRVMPVWVDLEDGLVCINSSEGRGWPKRVRRDDRVCVTVTNAETTSEYVEIRGRVVEDTHEGADEHIDRLAHKYLGTDYPARFEGEQRVMFRIRPDRIHYINLLERIPARPVGL
jgi:PPOX class probable F420-dependent enzyme